MRTEGRARTFDGRFASIIDVHRMHSVRATATAKRPKLRIRIGQSYTSLGADCHVAGWSRKCWGNFYSEFSGFPNSVERQATVELRLLDVKQF